jgi:hypothetical protein
MSPQQMNEQIMIGRAKNALLSFFEQRLSVPKIYLDADWQGKKVDVLGIDRAGVGDVSVALVVHIPSTSIALHEMHHPMPRIEALKLVPRDLIENLLNLPAHFKYIVAVLEDVRVWESERGQALTEWLSGMSQMFAPDGVGRIGVILVDLRNERPNISVRISAERFRSKENIYDLADAFASSHKADSEVREIPL